MTPFDNPLLKAIDQLLAPDPRHAWIEPAAEQIRKWRAEDEANGMPWESTRDGGCANNAPPVNR